MKIEIIREDALALSRKRWEFYVRADWGRDTVDVRLSCYAEETRPSRRHRKWECVRICTSDNRRAYVGRLIDAPAIPDGIQAEVRQRIADAITFR